MRYAMDFHKNSATAYRMVNIITVGEILLLDSPVNQSV